MRKNRIKGLDARILETLKKSAIRDLFAAGWRMSQISRLFGLEQFQVEDLLRGSLEYVASIEIAALKSPRM